VLRRFCVLFWLSNQGSARLTTIPSDQFNLVCPCWFRGNQKTSMAVQHGQDISNRAWPCIVLNCTIEDMQTLKNCTRKAPSRSPFSSSYLPFSSWSALIMGLPICVLMPKKTRCGLKRGLLVIKQSKFMNLRKVSSCSHRSPQVLILTPCVCIVRAQRGQSF
jgi:hypothetical protein